MPKDFCPSLSPLSKFLLCPPRPLPEPQPNAPPVSWLLVQLMNLLLTTSSPASNNLPAAQPLSPPLHFFPHPILTIVCLKVGGTYPPIAFCSKQLEMVTRHQLLCLQQWQCLSPEPNKISLPSPPSLLQAHSRTSLAIRFSQHSPNSESSFPMITD